MVSASALSGSVSVGYNLEPGWTYQWRIVQRHLARLREQYQGITALGNLDVEETVHALFLSLCHVGDWLHQDGALSLSKNAVEKWIKQHQDSLHLCCAYANTWKHMKRKWSGELIAQITEISTGPNGYKVTIGYRPWDQPSQPMAPRDALDLAEKSQQHWREFLTVHGIAVP